ncbi:MAG: hypothetical protein JWN89_385 [Parcubacteria group bacterium]|nr:hypothetical protein [Parcubacteria group bacterium]
MQKRTIINIVRWATAALLIPFFGNMYVSGWNWGPGDFIFAWVFFVLLGLTYTFVTARIARPNYRIAAGILVVAAFACLWILLATG